MASGTPEAVAEVGEFAHRPLSARVSRAQTGRRDSRPANGRYELDEEPALRAAEAAARLLLPEFARLATRAIAIHGAREHNLKNISLDDPARPDGRHHRPERLGQIDARLRPPLRRRPAPFSRQHVALRAAVRRAARKARCGPDRRPAADASRSSSASRAAAANRPSPRSRKSIIFSGCSSPRPGTQFCPECDLPVEKQSARRDR